MVVDAIFILVVADWVFYNIMETAPCETDPFQPPLI